MANRGVQELLRTLEAEYRYFLGSFVDYGPEGHDGVPAGGISFNRVIGQVVGVSPRTAGQIVDVVLTIANNTAWSWEYSGVMYEPSGGGFGRIFEGVAPGGGAVAVYRTDATDRISWNSGAVLNGSAGLAAPGQPLHLIGTKDAAGTGSFYRDGIFDLSGAVGTLGIDTLRIFDRAGLDRNLPNDCYVLRFYNTQLSADEAARLYEHSRIQLWPGAPKRSGIISPVV